jgi:acetyl esterase/lipase
MKSGLFLSALMLSTTPATGQAPSSAPMQMPANMDRIPLTLPPEPNAIALDTGGVPGMPPEVWEKFLGQPTARNVSRATVTPFLPVKAKATGAAVIVLPGGGFYGLSMVAEGSAVAKWFADRGIAAFVLKYRINSTPFAATDVNAFIQKTMIASIAAKGRLDFPTPPQSLEDAKVALRRVREDAAKWGVDPKRLGMVGFSAGAILALSTVLAKDGAKPDFVGLIYPDVTAVDVPKDAPPLFISIAVDDPLFGGKGYGLAESWTRARRPVELHAYQKGGHGYGLGVPGTTTTDWADGFLHWLQMNRVVNMPTAR